MRRLFVFNIEEVVSERNEKYRNFFIKKIFSIFPRFVFCLSCKDAMISPIKPDKNFLLYAAGVLGLKKMNDWFWPVKAKKSNYFLFESLLADKKLFSKIRKMSGSGWALEPFIQTPDISRLSKDLNMPLATDSPDENVLNGKALKVNDKAFFKKIAKKAKVPFIEGYEASSMAGAEYAVKKIAEKTEKVFVKKVYYGGGLGNLFGSYQYVIKRLKDFYTGGKVIIEPFLKTEKVYGSICVIKKNAISFLGVDEQTFFKGSWSGFDFPPLNGKDAAFIQKKTLSIAKVIKKLGVCGIVNIDWLKEKNTGKIYAIECNLRNNGFHFIMDFADRYFNGYNDFYVSYRENLKVSGKSFRELKKTLKLICEECGLPFIEKPGMKEGLVLISYEKNKNFSAAVFSKDKDKRDKLLFMLKGGIL